MGELRSNKEEMDFRIETKNGLVWNAYRRVGYLDSAVIPHVGTLLAPVFDGTGYGSIFAKVKGIFRPAMDPAMWSNRHHTDSGCLILSNKVARDFVAEAYKDGKDYCGEHYYIDGDPGSNEWLYNLMSIGGYAYYDTYMAQPRYYVHHSILGDRYVNPIRKYAKEIEQLLESDKVLYTAELCGYKSWDLSIPWYDACLLYHNSSDGIPDFTEYWCSFLSTYLAIPDTNIILN